MGSELQTTQRQLQLIAKLLSRQLKAFIAFIKRTASFSGFFYIASAENELLGHTRNFFLGKIVCCCPKSVDCFQLA